MQPAAKCIMYMPLPFVRRGVGWVGAGVSILEAFPAEGISPTLVIPRAFDAIAPTVNVKEAIPNLISFRYASVISRPALNYFFLRELSKADPKNTIVYFWPAPPLFLIRHARLRGFITVREMINTSPPIANSILDDGYARLGLRRHGLSKRYQENECRELELYDYFMSPNARVEESLVAMGVDQRIILRSTYGWSPARFSSNQETPIKKQFRLLFIGQDAIRKGVPQLLAAWKKSQVIGELLIVGGIDPILRPIIAPYLESDSVRLLGSTQDVAELYRSADAFVLPSLEEGDPIVTYEAASFGLPIIATPMGSANIVKHGINGLVVSPHDVDGLAEAIACLANSPDLRTRMGSQAAKDAQGYTFEKIGKYRARTLKDVLSRRDAISHHGPTVGWSEGHATRFESLREQPGMAEIGSAPLAGRPMVHNTRNARD